MKSAKAGVDSRSPRASDGFGSHVVRNEQDGQVQALLQLQQQIDDLRLHRDVERGHQLVGDQAFGLDRQRPGDADALALAWRRSTVARV